MIAKTVTVTLAALYSFGFVLFPGDGISTVDSMVFIVVICAFSASLLPWEKMGSLANYAQMLIVATGISNLILLIVMVRSSGREPDFVGAAMDIIFIMSFAFLGYGSYKRLHQ